MPTVTITFSVPEEQIELDTALKAIDYSIVVEDLDNWLRSKHKYENLDNISILEVREHLLLLMQERGIK